MHYIRILFEAMSLFIVSKFDVKCLFLSSQIKINIEQYLVREHSNVTHRPIIAVNQPKIIKISFFLSLLTPMISCMIFIIVEPFFMSL